MNAFPPNAAPEPAVTPRQRYADWPAKEDERPQPWDLDAVGISKEDRALDDGAPDTVSPVVIRHSYPLLSTGSSGGVVGELAKLLSTLGYHTDISRGENPFQVLSSSVMAAVDTFREDYHVEEDPTPFGGKTQSAKAKAAGLVGPYTWEALLRAAGRVESAA